MIKRKLTLKNYISYGMGDIFGGGAFTLIGSFFLIFLTNNVGISPILAGIIFGIGRVWMAFTDPLIGLISDATRSSFGRRRVFFLIGCLPIIVTFIPLWLTPIKVGIDGGTQLSAFIYYLVIYFLFDLVYSLLITPYAALVADMTYEYKERVKLSAFRMGFSQFSSILTTAIAPILLASMSYSSKAYLIMGSVFALLYTIIWIFVFLGTYEIPRNVVTKPKKKRKNFIKILVEAVKSFGTTFQNKTFRAHIGLYLFAFAALDVIMSFNAYFVNMYLQNPKLLPYASAMWISQVCVLPIYVYISNKFSKALAYRIGAFIWILAMLSFFTLTPNEATILSIILHFTFIGIGLSACYMIPMAMISFVTEVDTLMTKLRRTGIYVGAMSFSRKVSQGVLILPGLGITLSLIGYQKGIDIQLPSTLEDLKMVFILLPILLIIIGFYFSLKFNVNPKNFDIIKKEINRLESGGKKIDVSSNTKKICELVTGRAYEKLYK